MRRSFCMIILSKILSSFLSPFVWTMALLVAALLAKHPKKRNRISIAAFLLLLLFSNGWLLTVLQARFHAQPMPMSVHEKYTYGIVLGGMARYDETSKQGYFNMSSDRFIQTALLYKKGHIQKIIVSGGPNGTETKDDFREADFLAKNLVDLGIPPDAILVENTSRNTIENARFTKRILDSVGGDYTKSVLITSAFHIPRAVKTFEMEGIAVRPYPCAFSILPSHLVFDAGSLLPAAGVLDAWGGFFKEMLGRAYLSINASVSGKQASGK